MKRHRESSTGDRISKLPPTLAEQILTLLPVKDAVKTATLSRQWRHRWRNVPQLVFDADFARIGWSDTAANVNKLMMKIYKAVLLHNGPITKFALAIPGLRPCDEIDHLILYLAKNKDLQDLTLHVLGEDESDYVRQVRYYPSLYSALQLKALNLANVDFKSPSWFKGFRMLTRLELRAVTVDYDFFDGFIRKCPLLQDLKVLDCDAFHDSPVIEAPSLKVLVLRSFLDKIWFKHTPVLSVVSILDAIEYEEAVDLRYSVDIVALFASLPALQHLKFGFEFLQLLAKGDRVPRRLPTPLHHLKTLELDKLVLDNLQQARVLVCLIMSSPNLQTLTIRIYSRAPWLAENATMGSLQSLYPEPGLGCCFQSLEEMNIQGSRGSQVELYLVRLALANAPLLRRIVVHADDYMGNLECLEFLTEVTQYKRASKEAEVKYVWNDGRKDLEASQEFW